MKGAGASLAYVQRPLAGLVFRGRPSNSSVRMGLPDRVPAARRRVWERVRRGGVGCATGDEGLRGDVRDRLLGCCGVDLRFFVGTLVVADPSPNVLRARPRVTQRTTFRVRCVRAGAVIAARNFEISGGGSVSVECRCASHMPMPGRNGSMDPMQTEAKAQALAAAGRILGSKPPAGTRRPSRSMTGSCSPRTTRGVSSRTCASSPSGTRPWAPTPTTPWPRCAGVCRNSNRYR